MSNTFNKLRRADSCDVENAHGIYRVYEIPGLSDSRFYEGSGVERTYNMAATDKQFPDDEEAIPDPATVSVGDGVTKTIIRKNITHYTITCPGCDTEARKTPIGEVFCPNCGIVIGEKKLDRSADSAGRYRES